MREMGNNTLMLAARVFLTSVNDFSKFESHLLNKAIIDGKTNMVDSGLGLLPQMLEPLEPLFGKDQHDATGVYHFINNGDVSVGGDLQRLGGCLSRNCRRNIANQK